MEKIYLDHAAAEPVCEEAKEFVKQGIEMTFNPSSFYQRGHYNRQIIEKVRKQIADMINADPEDIIFTSGCSESNAMAIKGSWDCNAADYVVATEIEHSSILNFPFLHSIKLKVDDKGFVDEKHLEKMCKEMRGDTLFCIQHANNEIGVIQDIEKLSKPIHDQCHMLLVDAAQTFGKVPIDVKKMDVDFLSASAGKCGGIRGAGFLYVKPKTCIVPQVFGTQEKGFRGGTYNELAIGAFGAALRNIDPRESTVIQSKRDYLINELLKIKGVSLVGKRSNRLPNNVFITIDDLSVDSQQLVGLMDTYGFMVSAGSACHAGQSKISHVLRALGYTEETAKSCMRITLGKETSIDDLNKFIDCLKVVIKMHKMEKK